jgi:hypothetical protein
MSEQRGWCVPNAIWCAWTWRGKTKDQVRIAVTKVDANIDHSQAECYVDGTWVPLTEIWNGECFTVILYHRHYPDLEPYRFLSLEDWIDEQIAFI